MKRYSHQQIGDLLDKFMNGLTSLEEEAALGDYFRTHKVPQEWEGYRLMFDYFDRGMEGDLITQQEQKQPIMRQMGRRWWGIATAADIAAVIVSLTVNNRHITTNDTQAPVIVKNEHSDTTTAVVHEVEPQQLAVSTSSKPVIRGKTAVAPSRTRNLKAENDRLARENERLQRELEDLRRRAFIIDLEANGYKAVMNEDGSIVLIDLEQEIENELNQQLNNNVPEI